MMNSVRLNNIKEKLEQTGQTHLLQWWSEITKEEREILLTQLEKINFELLENLIKKHRKTPQGKKDELHLEPAEILPLPRTEGEKKIYREAKKEGEKLLREGKVCFVLVAGGDATRLGFDYPKGIFGITPVMKKSLFQLHAEKILSLGNRYKFSPTWYIMTSETNNDATENFFRKNNFFGLQKEDVIFFIQEMLPAIDYEGKLMLKDKYTICSGPSGHGGCMRAMKDRGVIAKMQKMGQEEIFYFQVDNVLVKIGDPFFVGFHKLYDSEMSSKIVQKSCPEEKIGVIGKINGKLGVIEYTELPVELAGEKNSQGNLKYGTGNIAIHLIKRSFVEQWNQNVSDLPFHSSHKKILHMNMSGEIINPESPNGIKFESFIFDCLGYTKRNLVMEVIRKEEFSPVKNSDGVDSPKTAVQDMNNFYGSWMESAGLNVPRDEKKNVSINIEVSPLFAIDREEFCDKFHPPLQPCQNFYIA